jgi:microfibrillar-associated protein 1
MQKYYHRGAFYGDSEDEIYKRDYNLPTPMELQDKSMLPSCLQKRKNDFGRKGQSKHTHLAAEDTTDFDPRNRVDEGIRIAIQRRMAGYKGAFMK